MFSRFCRFFFLSLQEGIWIRHDKKPSSLLFCDEDYTENIFIREKELKSKHYNRIFTSVFAHLSLSFRHALRALGEIVNKIMISLMEIYYPSNIGLGISEDDVWKLRVKATEGKKWTRKIGEKKVGNPLNLFVSFYCCVGGQGIKTHYYSG